MASHDAPRPERGAGLRRTPLHDCHTQANARIVPFAGWEMPVQYAGVIEEHMAVRTRAGLFDVSHMGEIDVCGDGAEALLQTTTCNDVSRLADGRAQYSALTTPEGTFVDDVIVHRRGTGDYFLCVNAANTDKDLDWLRAHADGAVEIVDRSEETALIALQGPRAAGIMRRFAGEAVAGLKRFRFAMMPIAGAEAVVARTGYTGEDGFEIYLPAEASPAVWRGLLEAGREDGIAPAGLGARDTLRLEAKLSLYGNDIDETTTVLEADLGWIVKLGKGEFVGRDVLARQKKDGVARRLAGFEMVDRGIARHGYPVLMDGRECGRVTSGSFAPFLRKNIGLAYLPVDRTEPGTPLEISIRGRGAAARVVPTPFYNRPA